MSIRLEGEDLRQLVHLLCGGGAFLLFYWPQWAVLALLLAGAMIGVGLQWDKVRAGRHVVPLFRSGESLAWNGAITYGLGVGSAVLLLPTEPAFIGWIVLAVGDSAATVVGRRLPLVRFETVGKSLGGSIAFAVSATAAVIFAQVWLSELSSEDTIYFVAATGAALIVMPAALAEIGSRCIDDNLTIPLAAGVTASFVGMAG